MDVTNSDSISQINDGAAREMQLSREDQSDLDVPMVGEDNQNRVTQSAEAYELSGSLSENDREQSSDAQRQKPGLPSDSVDNVDDAGIDPTRDPDWEVVEPTALPNQPAPNQLHNDKYWDERSLDRELQDKDLQEELIREETEDFEQAAEIAEDFSRPYNNDVLDPYYQSGSQPSNPPSAGNSLDSFV